MLLTLMVADALGATRIGTPNFEIARRLGIPYERAKIKPLLAGVYGGDRKSFDVHMHLMEAMTNLYEATQNPRHKERCQEIIDLIFKCIIHPEFGTGIAQFLADVSLRGARIAQEVKALDAAKETAREVSA